MPSDMRKTLTDTMDSCIKMQVSLSILSQQVSDMLLAYEDPMEFVRRGRSASDITRKFAVSLTAFISGFEEFANATARFTGGGDDNE